MNMCTNGQKFKEVSESYALLSKYSHRSAKVMHHLAHIHWSLRIYWERPPKVFLLMAQHNSVAYPTSLRK